MHSYMQMLDFDTLVDTCTYVQLIYDTLSNKTIWSYKDQIIWKADIKGTQMNCMLTSRLVESTQDEHSVWVFFFSD